LAHHDATYAHYGMDPFAIALGYNGEKVIKKYMLTIAP